MINDLPSHLQSKLLTMIAENQFILSLYADDVNSIISHKNMSIIEALCNLSIELLNEWTSNNDLKLNVKKTNYIQFKSSYNRFVTPPPSLSLDGEAIVNSDTCAFLGPKIIRILIGMNTLTIYVANYGQGVSR